MAEKPSMVENFQSLKLDEAERVNSGKEFLIKLDQK